MQGVTVSIIVTVHNRSRYLAAAIESILNQTYSYFECLIWDDGSTDDSVEIAHHYSQKDSRIRLITAPHLGRGQALQSAIDHTSHPYLTWVDSDDILAPAALAETVTLLERYPNLGMVYTNHLIINKDNQVLGLGQRCSIPYSPQRLLVDFMTHHFRLMRRWVYDQVGGIDPNFEVAQDYDLCLRLSEVTSIYHHPKPLYLYRVHPNSISHARKIEQIQASAQAVENALQRRGLSHRMTLDVEIQCKFILRQKTTPSSNKIFGIGLERTGTASLCRALKILGYQTLQQFPQRKSILFEAAIAPSITINYQQLDQAYPDAKFILTVRDVKDWLQSWEIYEEQLLQLTQGSLPSKIKQSRINIFGSDHFDPNLWERTYLKHIKIVLEYFQERTEDLLILRICQGEGWETLCPFLEKPQPQIPFPHLNAC